MKNLYLNQDGTFEALVGSRIQKVLDEAIGIALCLGQPISFDFNGVAVTVESDSNAELIYRDWARALSGYIGNNVGPHPKETLSEEERENDARIKVEKDKEERERQAKWAEGAKVKREAFEAKLATAPEMDLSDPAGWEKFVEANSEDGYSLGVVTYSQRWARLMQQAMDRGAELEDIASTTSLEADVDGITGFMYGAAVNALASYWKYGEPLRRWHNTRFGKSGEQANETGGVINPAVLTIG